MRISDWSSDVCSSDLRLGGFHERVLAPRPAQEEAAAAGPAAGEIDVVDHLQATEKLGDLVGPAQAAAHPPVGREVGHVLAEQAHPPSVRQEVDRKSVVWGKSVSGRVDPGGRRHISQKTSYIDLRTTTHAPTEK